MTRSGYHLMQGGITRTVLAKSLLSLAFAAFFFSLLPVNVAHSETRSLKLYFLHTGERDEIVFKRNGKYVAGGLKKINYFLRDWRRNEPTKMDPKLLDLIWEVYKETGSRKYIHVVSAYRSPATNNLLRKRGRGVARKSQHSLGKALDFFIPGVKLAKLREIGLKKGLGGVGYYPKSGSPFVHFDTGRVRHWPRMTRRELVRIFPNGKTLHVPTDGKPLPGYNIAKARYEQATSGKIVVAKAEEIEKKPNFFAKLLGRDEDESDDAPAATAVPKPVATVSTTPPVSAPQTAPQPVTPPPSAESLIAALTPDQLPIPVLAPREITPPTTELVVNQENPASETVEEQLVEQQIAQSVPVPVQAARQQEAPIEAIATIAETQAPAAQPVAETTVAALSPTEIQDLRREVYRAIQTPVTATGTQPSRTSTFAARAPDPKRFGPPRVEIAAINRNSGNWVPRPSAEVPSAGSARPANDSSLIGYAANGADTIPATTSAPTPGLTSETQTAIETQIATAPATVEAENTIAPVSEPTPEIAIAGIPVPQPSPSRTIAALIEEEPATQVASLEQPTQREEASTVSELSLEQFRSANLNERLVGKWALSADASIADIADIRPPAYGRNIIRERPNTVLSSGFTRENIQTFTNGFSGSSLEFLNFTRFR